MLLFECVHDLNIEDVTFDELDVYAHAYIRI